MSRNRARSRYRRAVFLFFAGVGLFQSAGASIVTDTEGQLQSPAAESVDKWEELYYIVYFKGYEEFLAARDVLASTLEFNWYVPLWGFLEGLTSEEYAMLAAYRNLICTVRPLSKEDIVAPSLKRYMGLNSSALPPANPCAKSRAASDSECEMSCDELPGPPDEVLVRLADDKKIEKVEADIVEIFVNDFAPKAALERVVGRAIYGPSGTTNQVVINLSDLTVGLGPLAQPSPGPGDEAVPTDQPRGQSEAPQEAEPRLAIENVIELLARDLPSKRVLRVDPREYATVRNGTTSWVIQSERRDERIAFDGDLRGRGQVVGLIDDFLDLEHCFFSGGAAPGPRHRKVVRHLANAGGRPSRHGTFVAGILAGARGDVPYDVANGQAPEARIGFGSVWDFAAPGSMTTTLFDRLYDLYEDLTWKGQPGARIFSNSWGNDQSCCYTGFAYDVDDFTWRHEDALVIFGVSNEAKIRSPENAKNALAVGASKQAGFFDEKASGGCGPTLDGRRKPEIFAPGCRIRSALVGRACDLGGAPFLSVSPGSSPYYGYSSSRQNTDCATSWAAPAVAGAAALVRQYYTDGYYPSGEAPAPKLHGFVPSGALLKATLLNATVDMTGVADGRQQYPNDIEGWGRLLLDRALFFRGESSWRRLVVWDVRHQHLGSLKPGDEDREYYVHAWNAHEPLKITLVWTEPPPAPIVRDYPVVNDLNLKVEPIDCPRGAEHFYLGNKFNEHGYSQVFKPGEEVELDAKNNVEQVVIQHPCGKYRITVEGKEIWVVPEHEDHGQGFALVASGAIEKVP